MIELNVNGTTHSLDIDPEMPLLWALRDHAGVTGTKFGCGIAECGSCTVHLDGQPIRSCITPVSAALRKRITTIEGFLDPDNRPSAVQRAFAEAAGIQCGFCSPGMVLSAAALLEANDDPSDEEIRDALVGNLCRCTGYVQIVESVRAAADSMRGEA